MATKVTVSIGRFSADGASLKQATERVIRKADEALGGIYAPCVVRKGDWAALVARDPVGGWGHALIVSDGETRIGDVWVSSGGTNGLDPDDARSEAIRSAWRHVCQCAWSPADGWAAPAELTDRGDRADHESWAKWQLRMRALMQSGLSDEESRLVISGHKRWPTDVADPIAPACAA